MIDILLPFYGDPALARQAVQSVLAQTSPDWRLLVVDDAHPDRSFGDWVVGLDHPHVEYRRNRTNLGVSENFRQCVELAEAEHVLILGGDDLLLPRYVGLVGERLRRHPTAALVQPGVVVIDESGRRSTPLADRVKHLIRPRGHGDRLLSGEALARSLMIGDWMYFPSVTWRRDVLLRHRFRPDLATALDLALLVDLVLADESFLLTDVEAFCYRRHAGSASSVEARTTARFAEERLVYQEAAARCDARGWDRAARAARARPTSRLHAAALAPAAVLSGQRKAARELVGHACAPG